ncbi:SpvB/TcaC N-terminal domain-containing protein [Reichenbachiella sp.]
MKNNTPPTQGFNIPQVPTISLPKGGGSISNIGEKFQANPLTGTASYEIPIKLSPGRNSFGPQLSLTYDSGNGNSTFGLGWGLGIPSIVRKTQKGIPKYLDDQESDTFILAGAEDLVPLLKKDHNWIKDVRTEAEYQITRYRPRIEGLYSRIERWHHDESGRSHWKIITKDNLTSVYGQSRSGCISDPNNDKNIFEWFLEKTYDDKGNCLTYEYKEEDQTNIPVNPAEKHRLNGLSKISNTYLKRIYYGNTVPVNRLNGELEAANRWLFEAVFDYGEHDSDSHYNEQALWSCRKDPQSTYRSGFEIRTYRLCKRVLMFHHFDELGSHPYLVASTNFDYEETPAATFLKSAQHWAHEKGKTPAPFPPITFTYSKRSISPPKKVDVKLDDERGLAIDPAQLSWTDLHNEGIPGLLFQGENAWWYKRNTTVETPAFENFKVEPSSPSINSRQGTTSELVDFDGDGVAELVVRSNGFSGFFEKENNQWSNFQAFKDNPAINWQDPNLRMVDLTGDGLGDILISEDHCFTWYVGKQRGGFEKARKVQKKLDENKGPNLVFNDSQQSIYLADISGDGLTDVVRVKNGSICYWPNLGYGRFGAQVHMQNTPRFEEEDQFDQKRLRLADIDGSGTTDILYIYKNKISYWINQSGNGFSEVNNLIVDTSLDNLSHIQVMDLYGKGTSCVVISHPSPHYKSNFQTIDLMKEGKPYLLKEVNNNMGAITRFHYCSSTKFYLEAEKAGNPWITKLPFPVQVLEKTEVIDEIENNRFTTRYAYHHGYYDGIEREFRGFGLVEQWDTETYEEHLKFDENKIEEELYVPPIYTKTWFHTGFFKDKKTILSQYQNEYYQGDKSAWELPDIEPAENWKKEEWREVARSLKGSSLRQEVYALDETGKEPHPYTVTQTNYQLRRIQPKGSNPFTVFDVLPSETLTYHYERNPSDPRVSHEMVLETDEYGHELLKAVIAYPRRTPAYDEQAKLGIIITQNDIINKANETDYYRLGISYQSRSYELTGLTFTGEKFEQLQIKAGFDNAGEIPFEKDSNPSQLERRILDHQKVTFYAHDLTDGLSFGEVAYHALPYQSYQLAFTSGLLDEVYGDKVSSSMLEALGYIEEAGDWWASSGYAIFDSTQFFQVIEALDHFGNSSKVEYDGYSLFPVKSINALGSESSSQYDYRVLQAHLTIDPNLNSQAVAFDVRGSVIVSAVIGKNGEGDTLEDPTAKMEYELFNWMNHRQPNYSKSIAREQHQNLDTPWQVSYTYSNGAGKEILTKVQAEDGEAIVRNPDGSLKKDGSGALVKEHTTDRWIGNGRVVINNKGKPVKQYEPYFSNTSHYEIEEEIREYGVTPINHYDPLERVIRTDLPDGTFTKVEFDPWKKETWDQNDLVLESEWYQQREAPDPLDNEPTDPEKRAAWQAARHAHTPASSYLDFLGRDFMAIEHNGPEGQYETKTLLDIEGNQKCIIDPKGRELARYDTDILGRPIYSWSADAGERWTLHSLFMEEAEQEGEEDQPLPAYTWDGRGFRRKIDYDALERPHQEWIRENGQEEKLIEWTVFGEAVADASASNLIGQGYLQFDQSGMVKSEAFDFKGNPLSGAQTFAKEYKQTIDWSGYTSLDIEELEFEIQAKLEAETFHSSSSFDALNRVIEATHSDQSIVRPSYNKANLLEKVRAQIRGAEEWTDFVTNINYDEKGQRQAIYFANGTKTNYSYHPLTYRLTRLSTIRQSDNARLQDLYYTYDPVGNITEIRDQAQQTLFFNNKQVEPSGKYEYDALYRLKKASGRELASLGQTTNEDIPIQAIRSQSDSNAVRRYLQSFQYDELGNILKMKHQADGSNWTRLYTYEESSNRLLETSPKKTSSSKDIYTHDPHGNMIQMPHLQNIHWDHNDQMKEVDLGGGGKAYYVYDSGGQRVRKVIERQGGKKQERLYLGDVEIYRKHLGSTLELERETLHISDDETRIVQIETKTLDNQQSTANSQIQQRYQYSNHLGSATLELDENAQIISYEEYHPFGSSAFRSGQMETEVSLKRYRYSGKERDDETGLYYYGARGLIPWLGRWSSADPAGFVDGLNVFGFVKGNPISLKDQLGFFSKESIYLKPISTMSKNLNLGIFTQRIDKDDKIHELVENKVREKRKTGIKTTYNKELALIRAWNPHILNIDKIREGDRLITDVILTGHHRDGFVKFLPTINLGYSACKGFGKTFGVKGGNALCFSEVMNFGFDKISTSTSMSFAKGVSPGGVSGFIGLSYGSPGNSGSITWNHVLTELSVGDGFAMKLGLSSTKYDVSAQREIFSFERTLDDSSSIETKHLGRKIDLALENFRYNKLGIKKNYHMRLYELFTAKLKVFPKKYNKRYSPRTTLKPK